MDATPQPSFGRALGETARSAHRLHLRALEDGGSDFHSWVVFTLLSESDGERPTSDLVEDLTRRLDESPDEMRALVDRLVDTGHLERRDRDDVAALSASGREHFDTVRQRVNALTTRLLDSLDPADVATTIRVLRTVGDRADQLVGTGS